MLVFSGPAIAAELQVISGNLDEVRMRLLPTAKAMGPLTAAQHQVQNLLRAVSGTGKENT